MNDRVPYTYLVTDTETGKRYYGVAYRKSCHPDQLGKSYFSSSTVVKKLFETRADSLTLHVRKVFDDVITARTWEAKFLKRVNAANSDRWYNLHNEDGKFFFTGPYTEEHRKKISKSKIGKKRKPFSEQHRIRLSEKVLSEEHKKAISNANKGKNVSEETRKKLAAASLGKKRAPFSEETRLKMSLSHLGKKRIKKGVI